MERWQPVPIEPYGQHYEVSDHGQVRRTTRAHGTYPGKILRRKNQKGYPHVVLHVDGNVLGIYTHQLVVLAFIGPAPTPKHEIAHNDGKPANCHYTNLRWATHWENGQDTKRHGTVGKITQEIANQIRSADGISSLVARQFNVSVGIVRAIKRGQYWKQ